MTCPNCNGKTKVIESITEEVNALQILVEIIKVVLGAKVIDFIIQK